MRAAARRLAQLDDSPAAVTGSASPSAASARSPADAASSSSRPGVLLRRLLDDPALDGVAAIIIDEVHERSLETRSAPRDSRRGARSCARISFSSRDVGDDRLRPRSRQCSAPPVVVVPQRLHPLESAYAPSPDAADSTYAASPGLPRPCRRHVVRLRAERARGRRRPGVRARLRVRSMRSSRRHPRPRRRTSTCSPCTADCPRHDQDRAVSAGTEPTGPAAHRRHHGPRRELAYRSRSAPRGRHLPLAGTRRDRSPRNVAASSP